MFTCTQPFEWEILSQGQPPATSIQQLLVGLATRNKDELDDLLVVLTERKQNAVESDKYEKASEAPSGIKLVEQRMLALVKSKEAQVMPSEHGRFQSKLALLTTELATLEEDKLSAVSSEDYDTAAHLKGKIAQQHQLIADTRIEVDHAQVVVSPAEVPQKSIHELPNPAHTAADTNGQRTNVVPNKSKVDDARKQQEVSKARAQLILNNQKDKQPVACAAASADVFNKMKVGDLRAALTNLGLSSVGSKAEMAKRLAEAR